MNRAISDTFFFMPVCECVIFISIVILTVLIACIARFEVWDRLKILCIEKLQFVENELSQLSTIN